MKKIFLGISLALLAFIPSGFSATLEHTITIDLTVYTEQPPTTRDNIETTRVTKSRLTNADILAALSSALQQDLSGGKLLLIDSFGLTNQNTQSLIVVRKGTNDVDVSSFFYPSESAKVKASVFNLGKNAYLTFTKTQIFSMTFSAANLYFSISGLATETGRTVTKGTGSAAVTGETGIFRANVAGSVTRGDATSPAQGALFTSPAVIKL